MNYFDIIVGIILILALVKGIRSGLIIELASLAALVLGVLGAVKFSGFTESWISQHWDSQYIGVASFIITFIVIVILVHLIAKAIDKLVKAVALGLLNRLAGGVFSLVKYAFIMSILLAVFASFDKTFRIIPEDTKESSILYEPLSKFAPSVFPYLRFNKEEATNKVKEVIEVKI